MPRKTKKQNPSAASKRAGKKKNPETSCTSEEHEGFETRKTALRKSAASRRRIANRLSRVKENDPALPLPRFVVRVNRIASTYLPAGDPTDRRVTREFTPRSIRHYQAKGIIDPPEKEGKEARYSYRQVLQAVLVRVMLSEGFRAPAIQRILSGKTTAEYESFLDGGPGAVKKAIMRKIARRDETRTADLGSDHWTRISVAPGIELHVASDVFPGSADEARELHQQVSAELRREFRNRRRARRAEAA